MRHFFSLSVAAAAAICFASTAWSQGAQGGGAAGGAGGASGAAGAGASGTAGAGAAGSPGAGANAGSIDSGSNPGGAGTAAAAGAAGTGGRAANAGAAGTAGGAGNVGANNATANGNNVGGNNATTNARGNLGNAGASGRTNVGQNRINANGFNNSSGISQRPFFTDPGARRQLNMTENQYNTLNRAYQDAYGRYNTNVGGLNGNLSAQQRALQMQRFQNQFNTDFGRNLDTTFTDPQVRARFDQLNRQYQGLNAFNDPAIQSQLNLTPQQQLQIRRLATEWSNQLGGNGTGNMTQQQWSQMYAQYGDQLNSILTPQQRQTWSQLTGERYTFPYELYGPQSANGNINNAAGNVNGNGPANSATNNPPAGALPSQSPSSPQSTPTSPATGTAGGAAASGTTR
jgi:hypothetical protein